MTCPLLLMALSVLSLNCNGIRDQPKRAGLVQWLRSLPVCVDIVCLQETHCLSLLECSLWFQSSGFSCALSCGSVHSCGCVVLFRPSLSLVNSWGDDDGRYLQCEVMFCGKSFRVCCIYAPTRNPARDQFFYDLWAKVDPLVPTILCGDFNAVFDRSVDKALLVNALALSQVWYVASLVHMPPWALKELSSLAFSFIWSGKCELVSRSVVVQPSLFGGFSVVDVKLKVWALLDQWVRRFASSSSGWVSFMSFWFNFHFGASPLDVLSRPYSYHPRVLPPFYRSLLLAWRGLDGSFSVSRDPLVYGASSAHVCSPVSISSTKACYLFLSSESMVSPHCVVKFAGVFGALDWQATWHSLFFFDSLLSLFRMI